MKNAVKILVLSSFVLSACNLGQVRSDQEIVVNEAVSFTLPGEFMPDNRLHDFAPIQFFNSSASIYLVGLEDEKSKLKNFYQNYSLDDYSEFVVHTVGQTLDTFSVTQTDRMVVNNLPCSLTQIEGQVFHGPETVDLVYQIAVVEGKKSFYQLVSWSKTETSAANSNYICSIVDSFQEDLSATGAESPKSLGVEAGATME